jgi:hypothetical protein
MKTIDNNRLVSVICATAVLAVSTSLVFALPPDPDNAALLYYQAFLLYEQPEASTDDMLWDLAKGKIEPNERIRQYIENCRNAIYYATAAADLQNCNWGVMFSDGFSAHFPHLAQTRRLTPVIIADARILAAENDYRHALDHCLTVRKMSQHIGDETLISFLVSMAISQMADNCLQDILGDMPQDLETLTWLKKQLVTMSSRALSVKSSLNTEQEIALETMHIGNVDKMLEALEPCTDKKRVLEQLDKPDAKALLEANRNYYAEYMASLGAILDASLPYAEKYQELKNREAKLQQDASEKPGSALSAAFAPSLSRVYSQEVGANNHVNAIKIAVDIYIIRAETGRLPNKLPATSPKDLFGGKDFEYLKTDNGFVLRCQGKDLISDKIHQYEFKVSE